MTAPRIFLVHAVDVSMAPASTSFKQQWPEANIINVLEESLAVDMLADGKMTPRMIERFSRLSQHSTIVLGQFSMAAAAKHPAIRTQARILTTPDTAVKKLKQLLK